MFLLWRNQKTRRKVVRKNSKGSPEGTAGSNMISNIPRAKIGDSVSIIQRMLLKKSKEFNTLDYIYVVNEKNVLRGIVSVKELLQAPKSMKVEKIMKRKLVTVKPFAHQERVVYLAMKHKIKAVPVVDKKNRFLGVVSHDTILEIFHNETQEDILKLAGIRHTIKELEVNTASSSKMIKARLPWLVIGLLGGVVAANVVGLFEDTLNTYISLAMFIPVLVYMSDAVGTQTETIFIRSMALDPKLQMKKYFLRECKVGLFIALFCGIILSVITAYGWGLPLLGLIIGVSMFFGIFAAMLVATLLPWVLKELKADPAMGSGPFATIITDITTLFIYFTIASLLIKYFA